MDSRPGSARAEKREKRRRHEGLLSEPTPEQLAILSLVRSGASCRVIANAGTGKTRTLLKAADQLQAPCLFLAYNRDIKEEVQQLARKHELLHLSVENYDSLLVNFYDKQAASQDFQLSLQRVLEEDAPPLARRAWSVVFIDEAQDLDETYVRFLKKVLRDHAPEAATVAQLVSVGDPKQSIFQYRGAAARYFLGDWLHEVSDPVLHLATTFRFGDSVCRFVDCFCAPLFGDEYLRHASAATGANYPVERWVIPPVGSGRPAARLIAHLQDIRLGLASSALSRPEDQLLVFLSGSRRESNQGLWAFVEALGAHVDPLQHPLASSFRLVVDQPADEPTGGEALAVVRNVHACKGKTFEAVVLFFTNRRSWFDAASGKIEREALYVALTRGKRLLIIEEAETLIFQSLAEKVDALDPAARLLEGCALPLARCASTGECFPTRVLTRAPITGRRGSYTQASLAERVSKLSVDHKRALLQLVQAPPLQEWEAGREEEPSTRDLLRRQAAWVRFEHVQQDERASFNAFLEALRRKKVSEAYALLSRSARARPLAPHLEAILGSVAARPTWSAREYLELTRFHPCFHYGYLALPEVSGEDEAISQEIFDGIRGAFSVLTAPQRVYQVCLKGVGLPVQEHGLYLAAESVVLLTAEELASESLTDRLVAAYVSCLLSTDRYCIRCVRRGSSLVAEAPCASGSVAQADRARYVALLDASLLAAP